MKKIYILILSVVLGACADQLDLKPQQSLDESVAMNSDANIKKALLGAYDGIGGYNANLVVPNFGSTWGGNAFLFSELLAADGEISWVGTFNQPREVAGKKILTNNTYVRNEWTGGYYTINICNNVLESIDKVVAADRDRVKGEALFIRGSVYFELVKLFGKPYSAGNTGVNLGVPLVLESTKSITSESQVTRNTVEQVYQQVLSDLSSAEALLPETNSVYATKTAAAAILSRVYLQMADYAKARDAADRVIQSDIYALTSSYAGAFNNSENSVEDIFAMQVNAQDGNNNMQTFWSIPDFGGRDGDVQINDKHLDLYEDGDERLELFYDGNGAIRSGKWKNQFVVVPVVRLAEMYLTRAESNFRLGTAVGDAPLDDINLLRDRVGLADLLPGQLNLSAILLERKLELAHEGSGVHDLKRLKGSADGISYDADAMVFPIPIREINANRGLEQNDGYN
jgi:starch-binding outer membrane protein, SusD/RagB family